jgi:hypothetical protein
MSIEGRIAIDVNFADSSDATGVQSLKKISRVDTTSYATGKIAMSTGTCGTSAVTVTLTPTTFQDSTGSVVSFASVTRIAFQADTLSQCRRPGEDELVKSSGNQLAVTQVQGTGDFEVSRIGTSGTAAYTLVMYGT